MESADIYWNNGWHGVTAEHRSSWRKAFPAAKIDTELDAMNQWLWANPTKRKKNYPRFIVNWFKRCHDSGSANSRPTHCSGNYRAPAPLTQDEIAKRVEENRRPGGACEQLGDLLNEISRPYPDDVSRN
tara:strand:+ start:29793 stop:30179 length:387 start_codon:yes stop_codon:yes gene_type:complete